MFSGPAEIAARLRATMPPGDLLLMSPKAMMGVLDTVEEKAREKARKDKPIDFRPLPGPQTLCYELDDTVDVIGFGGQAGGGKSGVAIGLALTKHHSTLVLRKESTQMRELIKITEKFVGNTDGFNENKGIWRKLPQGRTIEFGGVADDGDEKKWQGRAHDLKFFDEATEFTEAQVRFILAWLRDGRTVTAKSQKCTALLAFNPPTTVEGEWIIAYFGPWLDEDHPSPAADGEVRWFAMVGDKEREMPDNRQFAVVDGEPFFDFDPKEYTDERSLLIIQPQSRTFIRSSVWQNPYLSNSGYVSTLQSLPQELREQMLMGKFSKRRDEDQWQAIPGSSVDAAMDRWRRRHGLKPNTWLTMDEVRQRPRALPPEAKPAGYGADIARGGKDNTVGSPWYEWEESRPDKKGGTRQVKVLHLKEQHVWPGISTPTGEIAASLIFPMVSNFPAVSVDMIGYGVAAFENLCGMLNVPDFPPIVHGVNNGLPHPKDHRGKPVTDRSGRMAFMTMRGRLMWKFREMLDEQSDVEVELPPVRELRSDLCTPRYAMQSGKISAEKKEDVKKRLPERRSTDFGDSAILGIANMGEAKARKKVFMAC